LYNSAKIASGEASALGSTKTQAYRAKALLGSAKKASCEAKLASGEASVALSKAKATAFSKTKKQTFAKGAKPKASLQTLRPSALGLIRPDSNMNKSNNPDLRDYLCNKRKLPSEEPVVIFLSQCR